MKQKKQQKLIALRNLKVGKAKSGMTLKPTRKFKGFKIVEEFLPERINDHPGDWYVGDFLSEIFRTDLWILKNWKSSFRRQGVPFIVTIGKDRTRKKWKLWKAIIKPKILLDIERRVR